MSKQTQNNMSLSSTFTTLTKHLNVTLTFTLTLLSKIKDTPLKCIGYFILFNNVRYYSFHYIKYIKRRFVLSRELEKDDLNEFTFIKYFSEPYVWFD
jgi:hypothetical protein